MKNAKILSASCILLLAALLASAAARQSEPWTPSQLIEPADLAARLSNASTVQPLVICVGPSGLIKGSVETGPAHEQANIDSLRALLAKQNRNKEIVIYCGCCPFEHCPNIRPAFTLLNNMHFTHARLLDLSHNIKVDWINHGYPVKDTKYMH
jgi:hypothetical protein